MQDPNEDTEWNDVLRAKGIIPEKPKEKEVSEDDIIKMMEKTIKEKSGGKYWNERRKCVLSSLDIKIYWPGY